MINDKGVSESEIMQALEDCAKLGFKLNGYALELIKQKNEKIEELEKGIVIHVKIKDPNVYEYLFKTIRTEVIKDFAARLKDKKIKPQYPWDSFFVEEEVIDKLVNEMVGD